VLIDREGRPRLADFGIAEYYREDNGHSKAGTLGYMAPEVMMSQNHTYTADYYALGVITHELFFDRRPYLATTKEDLLLEIATKQLNLHH
jgi:serine/threonine protein kinase